ncbi:unnamed protein product [Phyllotreta striolata]|uniref:Protein kinase domain-containing protein n=1 Tax=Phyllotreta striolata TaxID=444603 RepID=A0A9N9TKR7_PHYSR|nr:unnamed protein product [Phyllotreta striolata]
MRRLQLGIILWEVLSRKKPFYNRGSSAFSIMWSVHMGKRPPLLKNCPQPIENLMTACWDKDPTKRPTTEEIVRKMESICSLLPGSDKPIQRCDETDGIQEEEIDGDDDDEEDEEIGDIFVNSNTNGDNVVKTLQQPTRQFLNPLSIECDPKAWDLDQSYDIHKMAGFDKAVPRNGVADTLQSTEESRNVDQDISNMKILLDTLDPHLRPVTPDYNDPNSVALMEEHVELAKEYWKVQTELVLMTQKKNKLLPLKEECEKSKRHLKELKEEGKSLELKEQRQMSAGHHQRNSSRNPRVFFH